MMASEGKWKMVTAVSVEKKSWATVIGIGLV